MSYCFFEKLTLPQREEYKTQMGNKYLLAAFLIEHGLDRTSSYRFETALNTDMVEIMYIRNEEILDAISESEIHVIQIDVDQFMQIVTFARAVSRVLVVENPDAMTEHWMDNSVVYHIAVHISSALSMSPEELFESGAEMRALLSTNETFAQSDWMIDWIVASRHAMGYERVPLPEKALVEKWNWNCHDMRDD
jgi:hypothetical protein